MILALAVRTVAADGDEARLTGVVVSESTRPVAGAEIEVQAERSGRDWVTVLRGRSGPDGEYSLGPLASLPCSLRLRVSSAGCATSSRLVSPGSRNTFQLHPGGEISGVVRWERTEHPVRGVGLELSSGVGDVYERVVTDESGEYRVSGLPPGSYEIASGAGQTLSIAGVIVSVSPGRTTRRDIWVSSGTTLVGRVTGADGSGAAGVQIRCGSLTTKTDAAGDYRLEGVPPCGTRADPGELFLEAEVDGHAALRSRLVLASGVPRFTLDFALTGRDTGTEFGPQVLVMRDGERLGGAELFASAGAVFRRPPGVSAGATGLNSSPDALRRQDGQVVVFARTPDGWIGASRRGASEGSAPRRILVDVVRPASIRGIVRSASGDPVSRASVQVTSEGDWRPLPEEGFLFEVTTDDCGRFSLATPPGTISLAYRRAGGEQLVKRLDNLAPGHPYDVELVVGDAHQNTGERAGCVVDEAGRPIEGARVIGWPACTTTDSLGEFRLASGVEGLVVSHPRFISESRFDLRDVGQGLMIVMRPAFEIRGRLDLGPDRTPIRQFRVWIASAADEQAEGTWYPFNDAEGRFTLPELPGGTYRIRVVGEGRASLCVEGVQARPAGSREEVVVKMQERVTVSGVVRNARGALVPYAVVEGAVELDAGRNEGLGVVAMTDATGRFQWPVLHGGVFLLRAQTRRGGSSTAVAKAIMARAGEDCVVELVDDE